MTTTDILLVLADIIQNELSLADGAIMIYNQDIIAPTTPGLYVVVGYVSGKAIGNVAELTDEDTGISETQSVSMQELIQIDLMSVDSNARQRKEEVIMALNSNYARQKMETYKMQIARIPGQFTDISAVEGHAMMTRFSMTITVLAVYTKNKAVGYYDDFSRAQPPTIVANR